MLHRGTTHRSSLCNRVVKSCWLVYGGRRPRQSFNVLQGRCNNCIHLTTALVDINYAFDLTLFFWSLLGPQLFFFVNESCFTYLYWHNGGFWQMFCQIFCAKWLFCFYFRYILLFCLLHIFVVMYLIFRAFQMYINGI